ncbi:MAG: ABC transporter substrate-binding protein [Oscillatoria sp. SIO1A7]|nr:ABC transporter substrate-binding protein [Oscillatoria sp. SIO1A7]
MKIGKVGVLLLAIALVLGVAGCREKTSGGKADIAIGSKSFTEQVILAELVAQHIENSTDLKVERRFRLQGTFICHNALIGGQIDSYVEYTGTSFSAIFNKKTISDPVEVYRQVKEQYDREFDIEVMQPLGFENTYAILVRAEDARKYNLKKVSQLAELDSQFQPGFGYEFIERLDGFPGLVEKYNLDFTKRPKTMAEGLMYRALAFNQVDVVAGNSTDGRIKKLDLFMLEDDLKYFPPYEAVPIFRKDTLAKYPELREAIAQLAGKISATEMQEMNYQVDGEFRKLEEVVTEFLESKGLI